jgi:hypothetical protein
VRAARSFARCFPASDGRQKKPRRSGACVRANKRDACAAKNCDAGHRRCVQASMFRTKSECASKSMLPDIALPALVSFLDARIR